MMNDNEQMTNCRVQIAECKLQIDIRFDEKGLVPAVVQDMDSGQVLMVAWMNGEALRRTQETGQAHFWSRSRQELWHKGATSGNVMHVREIWVDCDADTLLVKVDPAGPACHTGEQSCFYRRLAE
jgi:phosphoribosyl-AMP cyclohydrolase